jgi:hypothetical protein
MSWRHRVGGWFPPNRGVEQSNLKYARPTGESNERRFKNNVNRHTWSCHSLACCHRVAREGETPYCPEIIHIEGAYKIGSLCIFIPAFYFMAWRRFSSTAALLIPLVQLASGFAFASYINILPKICLN